MHCISILINFLPLFWEFAFLYFYFYFEKKYSWTLNTRMDLNWILSKCLKTHFFHRQWILVLLQKKFCFYDDEGKIKQIDRIESIVWQRLKRNSHTYKFFPCPYVAWIMHQVPFREMKCHRWLFSRGLVTAASGRLFVIAYHGHLHLSVVRGKKLSLRIPHFLPMDKVTLSTYVHCHFALAKLPSLLETLFESSTWCTTTVVRGKATGILRSCITFGVLSIHPSGHHNLEKGCAEFRWLICTWIAGYFCLKGKICLL